MIFDWVIGIAVNILSFLPVLGRRVGRWWIKRENYIERIKFESSKVEVQNGHARPYLIFKFNISSKVPHDLTIQRIVSEVRIASAYVGDKTCESDGLGCNIPALKKFGEGWVFLWYAPHDLVGIEKANPWEIKGYVLFSSRIATFSKEFVLQFRLDDNQVESLKKGLAYR